MRSQVAHIESFGGCMLGQLCPPSMLIAISVLEALFFERCGIGSVSMSLTQQACPEQDVAALRALRQLADEILSPATARHIVLYTYMGLFPSTPEGAMLLCDKSIDIAIAGGADRVIVKTDAEAHRIPTIDENVASLLRASHRSRQPRHITADPTNSVLIDARSIVRAVLALRDDPGGAIVAGFKSGVLDVPYCLHPDNAKRATSRINGNGRIVYAETGNVPVQSGEGNNQAAVKTTSSELLSMLNYTSSQNDQRGAHALRIAIIGGGPRGLSVMERLVAENDGRDLIITIIDPQPRPGGRIWQPDQPSELLMNTAASEVTMFSGASDDGPARAGSGPSLAEWLDSLPERKEACSGDLAPRAIYGQYLAFFKDAVMQQAPENVHITTMVDECEDLSVHGAAKQLMMRSGRSLTADVVVLATGHPKFAPAPDRGWISADSAADLDLSRVAAGDLVGVRGMGLTFFDVLSLLTVGRGGAFHENPRSPGRLVYTPSGAEPRVVPGSRSGIPIPGRGANQKTSDWSHQPIFVTEEWVRSLRGAEDVLFARDIEPRFVAEAQAVGAETQIRLSEGEDHAQEFRQNAAALQPGEDLPTRVLALATTYTRTRIPVINLETLARPFGGGNTHQATDWSVDALLDWVEEDLSAALRGNRNDPLKAALDAFRDTRQHMMQIVDHCGLGASCHQDYLQRYVPRVSLLSAGPPARRLAEFAALIRAGVIEPLGPQAVFMPTPHGPTASSAAHPEPVRLDWVIDARIPAPALALESDTLLARLRDKGLVTEGHNIHGGALALGGIDTHQENAAVLDRTGRPVPGVYAIGIPTEGKRWFTQVGSGRPGTWNSFHLDAQRVASSALSTTRDAILERAA